MSTQVPAIAVAWGYAWGQALTVGEQEVWAVGYLLELVFSEEFIATYILLKSLMLTIIMGESYGM